MEEAKDEKRKRKRREKMKREPEKEDKEKGRKRNWKWKRRRKERRGRERAERKRKRNPNSWSTKRKEKKVNERGKISDTRKWTLHHECAFSSVCSPLWTFCLFLSGKTRFDSISKIDMAFRPTLVTLVDLSAMYVLWSISRAILFILSFLLWQCFLPLLLFSFPSLVLPVSFSVPA